MRKKVNSQVMMRVMTRNLAVKMKMISEMTSMMMTLMRKRVFWPPFFSNRG
jgi:hypothetical protein